MGVFEGAVYNTVAPVHTPELPISLTNTHTSPICHFFVVRLLRAQEFHFCLNRKQ